MDVEHPVWVAFQGVTRPKSWHSTMPGNSSDGTVIGFVFLLIINQCLEYIVRGLC